MHNNLNEIQALQFDILYMLCYYTDIEQDSKILYIF